MLPQRDGESLHKYIQIFGHVHHNIPDVHPADVIAAFHTNMHNRRMREDLNIRQVMGIGELYALVDKCARAEEGRRLPREDAGAVVDSEDDDASTPKKKGQKHSRKCKGKAMLAIYGFGHTGKNPKTEDAGKEVAVCTCGHVAAAGEKTNGPYCKIHRTAGHDFQECLQVEQLAKKQKQEYENRDKEKGQNGASGSGKENRGRHVSFIVHVSVPSGKCHALFL